MNKYFAIALILFCLPAAADDVTLAWDPSPTTAVTGYKIYVGTASRLYQAPITAGNVLTYTVTALAPGATYYFAATAYDSAGNESDFSNEVFKAIAGFNRCDLNGDGLVNALDIQQLVNILLSGSKSSGDINADSQINVLDLQILSNVVLGRQLCPGK